MATQPADHDATTPEATGRARISAGAGTAQGWFRAYRSADALELLSADPRAFALLFLVAYRARWRRDSINMHGLEIGEAMVGDYGAVGMTRQQHREALARLVRYGMVATVRTTTKGTVVKLCSNSIFDPLGGAEQPSNNHQTTIKQPSNNHQTTTKKNGKNEEGKEEETPLPPEGGEVLPFGEDFRKVWEDWKIHRREKRQKLTPKTTQKQLAMLSAMTEAEAVATIERSIEAGWLGLFPERSSPGKTSRLPAPAEDFANFRTQEV